MPPVKNLNKLKIINIESILTRETGPGESETVLTGTKTMISCIVTKYLNY